MLACFLPGADIFLLFFGGTFFFLNGTDQTGGSSINASEETVVLFWKSCLLACVALVRVSFFVVCSLALLLDDRGTLCCGVGIGPGDLLGCC